MCYPYKKNSVVFVQNCAKSVHFHPISRNGRIQPRHEFVTRLKPHNVQFCSNYTVDQGCNPTLDRTLCASTQNTCLTKVAIPLSFTFEFLCIFTQITRLTKDVIAR